MTRRIFWISLLAGAIASLLVSLGVATQSVVIGSREGNWAYDYRQPFTPHIALIFAVVAATAFALCAVPWRFVRRHQWRVVLAWLLVGLAQQGLLRSLTPFSFEQIFASDTANSFYSPTRQYRAATLLTDFSRVRRSLPLHAQSNMPGKLMLVSGLGQIASRPAAMAWLVVIISNLGGVLLYVFVRDLFRGRRIALYSLILYLFVPAKIYFFPLLNTVTPLPALACACLLMRWLCTRHAAYAALFGATLYALIFFEPLPLVMGLLFGALTLRALWRRDIGWTTWLWQGAVAVIAFAAVYASFVAGFHFDLFETLGQARADAAAFNIDANRPYAIWVRQNLLDFVFGVGVCPALVFCAVLGDTMRRAAHSRRALGRPIAVLALGLGGVLLVTDLLGLNRGEVTRLWIFLACFFQIPAAYACARLHSRVALIVLLGTTLLQCALGTAMVGFIVP